MNPKVKQIIETKINFKKNPNNIRAMINDLNESECLELLEHDSRGIVKRFAPLRINAVRRADSREKALKEAQRLINEGHSAHHASVIVGLNHRTVKKYCSGYTIEKRNYKKNKDKPTEVLPKMLYQLKWNKDLVIHSSMFRQEKK